MKFLLFVIFISILLLMRVDGTIIVATILAIILFNTYKKNIRNFFYLRSKKNLNFIRNYQFSNALKNRVHQKHKYLSKQDIELVFKGLRDYFLICALAEGKMVAMPSEIIDVAWHDFLLFTREYENFCDNAFGKFLHHTPTEAMESKSIAKSGIKRAWRLACAYESINPQNPSRLPLIFAIDKKLNIKNGFFYELNCQTNRSTSSSSCGGYCATHIGCASGCGGALGCGGDSGGIDFGCGGDSGCGGDGCGGD